MRTVSVLAVVQVNNPDNLVSQELDSHLTDSHRSRMFAPISADCKPPCLQDTLWIREAAVIVFKCLAKNMLSAVIMPVF